MKKAKQQAPPPAGGLLKKAEVLSRIGVTDTTLYRLMKKHGFPMPVLNRPGHGRGRPIVWIAKEVEKWLKDTDPLTRMERATYPVEKPGKEAKR